MEVELNYRSNFLSNTSVQYYKGRLLTAYPPQMSA